MVPKEYNGVISVKQKGNVIIEEADCSVGKYEEKNMYAVKAIYDGINFKPIQPISVNGRYEVVITFLEPMEDDVAVDEHSKKRPLSELRGFMKGNVWMADDFNAPLEEMREYME